MLNHIDISLKRITPPQQCLNFCRQNIQVERLFYKIISAHIHGHDDIHIVRRR